MRFPGKWEQTFPLAMEEWVHGNNECEQGKTAAHHGALNTVASSPASEILGVKL